MRTRHASAGNCGPDASWQQAGRVARVGKAAGAAGGMQVSRVGLQSGHVPCLRAPPHSPAVAGLFVGRRSATAHAPPSGLALAQGWQGRCASSPCAEQPGLRRSALRGGLSRLRPCQPCASALWLNLAARRPGCLPSLARHTARLLPLAAIPSLRACVACAHRRRQSSRAPSSLPQGIQGPGMARDGPQAVPSELVCVCDPVGRYFTSVKPTLPSGATV